MSSYKTPPYPFLSPQQPLTVDLFQLLATNDDAINQIKIEGKLRAVHPSDPEGSNARKTKKHVVNNLRIFSKVFAVPVAGKLLKNSLGFYDHFQATLNFPINYFNTEYLPITTVTCQGNTDLRYLIETESATASSITIRVMMLKKDKNIPADRTFYIHVLSIGVAYGSGEQPDVADSIFDNPNAVAGPPAPPPPPAPAVPPPHYIPGKPHNHSHGKGHHQGGLHGGHKPGQVHKHPHTDH